jgi:hypothetical protein
LADTTAPGEPPAASSAADDFDSPLERLELLAGEDEAIASFLDEIDVHSPREREMLGELARTTPLARPDRFFADHRRAVAAIESLRRHGFHGARPPAQLGPLRLPVRWGVELAARYIVVSHVRTVATNMRNLYWLREIEAENGSDEMRLLRPARQDAVALVEITRTRELGIPAFLIGGLLVPLVVTIYRAMTGVAIENWVNALIAGAIGAVIGLVFSWVVLRGAAMASRRIRLSVREPLQTLWESVGNCGSPPRDQSRKFAIVAISLTVGAWFVLPLLVGIAFAT